MSSALSAVIALTLAVSAFVPFGPHALAHAAELEHHHDHDGSEGHHHELQPAPETVRITASGVQLPAPALASFTPAPPDLKSGPPLAPAVLSRSLDPPPASLSPQLAALCPGNRAPPA